MARNPKPAETGDTPSTEAPAAEVTQPEASVPAVEAPTSPLAEGETKTEAVAEAGPSFEDLYRTAIDMVASGAKEDGTPYTVDDLDLDPILTAYRALTPANRGKQRAALQQEATTKALDLDTEVMVRVVRFTSDLGSRLEKVGAGKKAVEVTATTSPIEAATERLLALHFVASVAAAESERLLAEHGHDLAQAQEKFLSVEVGTEEGQRFHAVNLQSVADLFGGIKRKAGRKPKADGETSGSGKSYDGPRRDIAKHIEQAFGSLGGTEHPIGAIAKAKTAEYPEGDASGGAIRARFEGKGVSGYEMVDVKTDTGREVKGVRKVA